MSNILLCRLLGLIALLAVVAGYQSGSIDPFAIPLVALIAVFLLGIPSRMLR